MSWTDYAWNMAGLPVRRNAADPNDVPPLPPPQVKPRAVTATDAAGGAFPVAAKVLSGISDAAKNFDPNDFQRQFAQKALDDTARGFGFQAYNAPPAMNAPGAPPPGRIYTTKMADGSFGASNVPSWLAYQNEHARREGSGGVSPSVAAYLNRTQSSVDSGTPEVESYDAARARNPRASATAPTFAPTGGKMSDEQYAGLRDSAEREQYSAGQTGMQRRMAEYALAARMAQMPRNATEAATLGLARDKGAADLSRAGSEQVRAAAEAANLQAGNDPTRVMLNNPAFQKLPPDQQQQQLAAIAAASGNKSPLAAPQEAADLSAISGATSGSVWATPQSPEEIAGSQLDIDRPWYRRAASTFLPVSPNVLTTTRTDSNGKVRKLDTGVDDDIAARVRAFKARQALYPYGKL